MIGLIGGLAKKNSSAAFRNIVFLLHNLEYIFMMFIIVDNGNNKQIL